MRRPGARCRAWKAAAGGDSGGEQAPLAEQRRVEALAGVFGVVCAAIGAVMGTEVVKLVCGIGAPLVGRLLVFDALAMTWRQVTVRAAAGREPVTELIDYPQFCSTPASGRSADVPAAAQAPAAIDVHTLRARLRDREQGRDDFVLVDVREGFEREIVTIPGSVHVPLGDLLAGAGMDRLPPGRRVVLHCKSGARSAAALEALRAAGRTDAVHVAGGVLAWVKEIDPSLTSY